MTNPAALLPSKEHMIAIVGDWVERLSQYLNSDTGRRILRERIKALVLDGTMPTMQVIAAARAGHQDADMALRELAAELLDRGDISPDRAQLRAYGCEALFRAPTTYPRGNVIADFWLRDACIAFLVQHAVAVWPHLKATRNRESKKLCAASLVAAALKRGGVKLSEFQVARIHAENASLARRLEASIPPLAVRI